MNPQSKLLMDRESVGGKDGGRLHQNCAELNEVPIGSKKHQQTQPQLQSHRKKQVRRRYHATRSYQGKVLNMAEARREIAAALKIHRASMKETEKQNKQQQFPLGSSTSALTEVSHKEIRSRPNTRMYPANAVINISSSFEGNSCQTISHPQHFSLGSYTTRDAGKLSGDFNITTPNQQPLGLHLSLHNSGNIGYSNSNRISSSMYLLSSSSSVSFSCASSSSLGSSYASTALSSPKALSCSIKQIECETSEGHVVQALHPAMDDEKMAEIRLIGEQHDMEWNDKLNMATLAWWYKFFKSAEAGSFFPWENSVGGREEGHDFLNEPMNIPSWVCDQQQFNNYIPEIGCSLQDGVTQCLDTGDTKETDVGWLS